MASNYSYIHHSATSTLPYKSKSSVQLYGTTGSDRRGMGVLVTGPWPMSQPIYPRAFVASTTMASSPSSPSKTRMTMTMKECLDGEYVEKARHGGSLRHYKSHGHLRPLSMPAAFNCNNRYNDPSPSSCYHENAIEMVPLNISPLHNHSPLVPNRASFSPSQNPISPPTCVPWLKKMKLIKKIQRRIVGSRSGGMSPNNMPPLLFHHVHGENVAVSHNRSTARRSTSFCNAIVFSNRPVKIAEKVSIKLVDISTSWSGVLRIGFTSHDPATLKSGLPKYVVPELTQRPGFWAKAFPEALVKKDSVLFYYTTPGGDVHFGMNGEERGIFLAGVDTRRPLWVVLDIYGNTTGVEFVDPRGHLNNSRRSISECPSTSREEIECPIRDIVPALNGLKLLESSLPEIPYYRNAEIHDLPFHRVRGRNVMCTADTIPNIAIRRSGEYNSAYVFTSRPIQPDETVLIQILIKDEAHCSSLAFGLTACNPQSICSDTLPEDSQYLLDRPEYWVVKQDIANSPNNNDVLAFTLSSTGEVTMAVNGGPPICQMHVDNSIPLWAFFDLYGTTERIRCVGTIKSKQAHSSQNLRKNRESFITRSTSKTTSSSVFNQSSFSPAASSSSCLPSREYLELSQSPNALKACESMMVTPHSLKEQSNWSVECVACCERPVDSVFYSCGHMCMCYNCAVEYWKSKEKGCCPICRANISDVIRTYKS